MRRWLLPLVMLVVALSGSANAQDRVFRVGVLSPTGAGSGFTTISTVTVPELATLGFIEGRNIVLEYRVAEGVLDRLTTLAQELVQGSPDVIIANGPLATRAAGQATKTIPVVMLVGEDPVAAGWVASLARPGGNITGVVLLGPELDGKRLELLHEAVPARRRIAVLVESGVTKASLDAACRTDTRLGTPDGAGPQRRLRRCLRDDTLQIGGCPRCADLPPIFA
jgi:putative ABC transport system substrate-binding protein